MTETLRDRQKRVAREVILQATADEIVEQGVVKLSLQAIADRAGVSIRTLYNYFDNRDTLIAALAEWSDEVLQAQGGYKFPDDPARLAEYARVNFLAWTAQGNLMKALVQLEALNAAEGARLEAGSDSAKRAGFIEADVLELCPSLAPDEARAVAHTMRAVISGRTWHRLTVESQVESELAASAVAWAYRTLRRAVSEGNTPFRANEGKTDTPEQPTEGVPQHE
ncbi:MAG: TetR/AcrR family transcriptional regulator [Dehalococcoidia bacterium]